MLLLVWHFEFSNLLFLLLYFHATGGFNVSRRQRFCTQDELKVPGLAAVLTSRHDLLKRSLRSLRLLRFGVGGF